MKKFGQNFDFDLRKIDFVYRDYLYRQLYRRFLRAQGVVTETDLGCLIAKPKFSKIVLLRSKRNVFRGEMSDNYSLKDARQCEN